MDSLTHIALGACIGEAYFEKGFGKRAMLWGMLAQSIPDIDFIASFWMDTSNDLLAHRGITHSILFAVLVIPLFAIIADRMHRPHDIMFKRWLLFFATEVFGHLLLDGFNNYGVGWLEPFSHARYSFNATYVVDPFLSIWPAIACGMLLILDKFHRSRTFWWLFGVIIPLFYLTYCGINKINVDKRARENFALQHISYDQYFTSPAPLQNWLWFVVAGNDEGFHVGFCSMFDQHDDIHFEYFPRQDSLLNPIRDQEDLHRLIRFSQNFYTVEKWHDTLVFNDLRFGQVVGWQNPREKFVFHYYLTEPDANDLVVQRGRFEGWNGEVVRTFWRRIRGL